MLSLQEFVQNRYNKTIAECSNEELYLALLNYSKLASSKKPVNTGKKKVYYISAEFLIGKLLSNNLSMHQIPMTLRTDATPISGRWRRPAARMRMPRDATKT